MPLLHAFTSFRPWRERGLPDMRIWVLLILLAGRLLSPLGEIHSHGLADIAAADHGHDHDHEFESDGVPDATPGHPHHNSADHFHEQAHALPVVMVVALPTAPVWHPLMHLLALNPVITRLDRPPRA
jgi:hypothetical protein